MENETIWKNLLLWEIEWANKNSIAYVERLISVIADYGEITPEVYGELKEYIRIKKIILNYAKDI